MGWASSVGKQLNPRGIPPSMYDVVVFMLSIFLCLADMWSVGCVMAELLTGQVLFPGSDCILPCIINYSNINFATLLYILFIEP